MSGNFEERLRAFYELRATEEPADDPAAALRFRKAVAAADLSPEETVLDLGAKWGGVAKEISNVGLNVNYTGIDLSRVNVDAAIQSGLKFTQADVTRQLPFEDSSQDCVFCLEVLEHLTMPVALLGEIRRILKDRGRAVVSVPSPYSFSEILREVLRRDDTEGHLNCFTRPIMQNAAALTGFRIERDIGTSIQFPKMTKVIPTDSFLARSRIYVLRPSDDVVFAGRSGRWET